MGKVRANQATGQKIRKQTGDKERALSALLGDIIDV